MCEQFAKVLPEGYLLVFDRFVDPHALIRSIIFNVSLQEIGLLLLLVD